MPQVQACTLTWNFTKHLFFVHLNQKQDSNQAINTYRKLQKDIRILEAITDLSKKTLVCYTLEDLERILNAHEKKIASLLGQATVKELIFPDYPKTIKSLGAWGGDFVLATGSTQDMAYFKDKGYTTIIAFDDMIA